MDSPKDKMVLIIGGCNREKRLHSYVIQSDNSISLQIIDTTKNVEELEVFDESYFTYIEKKLLYFVGPEGIRKIDAVICYNMEHNFKNTLFEKLNPQCLMIDFSKANMTENELFKNIFSFDKKLFKASDIYQNGLFIWKGFKNRHSIFAQLPKELLSSILDLYSKLPNNHAAFRFFKALHSPAVVADNVKNQISTSLG